MKPDERDAVQLETILLYTERLCETMDYFDGRQETFRDNTTYQDACSLCLIQIGEAVHRLSEGFTAAHPEIEWYKIYGMRNHLVHGYGDLDTELLWASIQEQIPALREFCLERVSI